MDKHIQKIELLMDALAYIEMHLSDEIQTEDVSAACFCSKSTLEKVFRNVHNISVHEYIIRRRMMFAAKQISQYPEMSILDIALESGYSTHESFARAFESVWNCKPSTFRRKKFSELFPRLHRPPEKGDYFIMQRKHVDISELFDLFRERKDCFFVLSDIKGLIPINEISDKAGDLAILEQMRRMTAASGEDDVVFRIGGDEFCILTASSDRAYAQEVADKVCKMNCKTFSYENQEIPLELYVSVTRLEQCQHYDELFAGLHHTIRQNKE